MDSNHNEAHNNTDHNNNNIQNENRPNDNTGEVNGRTNGVDTSAERNSIPTTQEAHTREKLFDFIALMQGRRMDDQRAILKPTTST